MQRLADSPARWLGSIAHRYRHAPGRRWPPQAFRGPWWRYFGPACGEDDVAAEGPLARNAAMARLEAVLFLAREPQSTRRLAQLADLADGTEARSLVRKLNGLYDESGCAFRAVEVAGGFQLMSRPKFAPWLRRLQGAAEEVRLSPPAMETLAVVAYRQPVLRADVEAIRGVQCGEILRQLMERDLVRITGRSEELGRPFLYGTSKRFLQVFGLRHLDELPRAELVRPIIPEGKPHSTGDAEGEQGSQAAAGSSP
jgi:segregation and condensation protein B